MDKLTRTQRVVEKLIESNKLWELGFAVLKIVILLTIGLIVLKLLMRFMRKVLDKSSLDEVLYKFILNSIKVTAIIILITMCLGILGMQMSTVIAVIGAAGAAIALALRDSLSNIAGGVMIIVNKPFRRDDFIDIGNVSGKVREIDLFVTTLNTNDNKTITVPNGLVNTSILINHSREGLRRVDCSFSIGYSSDIKLAKDLMRKVCRESSLILDEPEPVIGVSGHAESAVTLDLLAWCRTEDYWTVRYMLEERVKEVFDDAGIEIPYPCREVFIRGES